VCVSFHEQLGEMRVSAAVSHYNDNN